MRAIASIALLAIGVAEAQDPLLDRVRRIAAERLANTPNFTCVLEIERSVYPSATSPRFLTRDRTRLEVSVVDGRELFAWPGESFEERPLTDFLGPGVASTGEFSAHGLTVFGDPRTTIEPAPGDQAGGRSSYSYRVPVEASQYVVHTAGRPHTASYEGVFHVDNQSAQVLGFEVNVPKPPAGTGIARVATVVDYAQTEVGGSTVWLPSTAEIEVESAQGPTARNQLRFPSCRSFQAETTIRFFDEGDAGSATESAVQNVTLPQGLELPLELRDPISSDRAWAGDRFSAVSYKSVKAPGDLLILKGAEVSGRVVRIETIDRSRAGETKEKVRRLTAISLQLAEIRWGDSCAPISATLELVERIPQMGRLDPSGRVELNRTRFSTNRAIAYDTRAELSEPSLGTFIVHGEFYLIRTGARMRWITGTAPETACAEVH